MHSIHWQNVILLRLAPNALPNSSLPYHTRYPSSTTYTYKFTKFPHSHTDCLASTVTRRYHGKYCDSIWWSVYSNKMLATDTNVKCFGCYGYWHNFVVWPVNFRHNRQAKTCSVMSVFIPCGIANHHERRTTNDDDNKNVRVRLWVCVPCFGMRTLAENNNNNNKFEERENPSNKNITFQHFAEPREKFICHSPNNVSLFRSISLPHTLSVCAALFPRYSPPECLCMCVHSVSLSLFLLHAVRQNACVTALHSRVWVRNIHWYLHWYWCCFALNLFFRPATGTAQHPKGAAQCETNNITARESWRRDQNRCKKCAVLQCAYMRIVKSNKKYGNKIVKKLYLIPVHSDVVREIFCAKYLNCACLVIQI